MTDDDVVTRYWLEHYTDGKHCVLCGNTGFVDTRPTAMSPLGGPVGTLTYCVCPNGQFCRRAKTPFRPKNN